MAARDRAARAAPAATDRHEGTEGLPASRDRSARADEVGTQEPVVGVGWGRGPPLEEVIVEEAGAQLARREREGVGGRRRPVDRAHHPDAVAVRLGAGASALVMRNRVLPVALHAVDDQAVGRRAVAPEKVFIAIVPPVPV